MRENMSKITKAVSSCSMKHLSRKTFWTIVAAFLCVILVIGILVTNRITAKIESRTIRLGFEDIGELATQSGYFTNVQVISKNRKIFDIVVPLTEGKYIFSYDGVIKAGIDFTKISVKETESLVTVTLPEAKILSCEVNPDSLKVYDESQNIFSPLKLDDMENALKSINEEAKSQAIADGILDEARNNAQTIIRAFLCTVYNPDVFTIEFK